VTVDDVLAAVAARVAYLRASTAPGGADWVSDDADWVSCEALAGDPTKLTDVVTAAAPGFGTDELAVSASLFAQAYAFRVAGVPLAAYALGLPVPDAAPATTWVRTDKPRPSAVAYTAPDARPLDARDLVRALLVEHLAPFVEQVHASFTIGARLLWGNVASSCAVAFRAVESSGADAAAVRRRAEAFVDAAAPWFDGLGGFGTLAVDGREGWFWDRTNCCLWYRASGGALCDNCSLHSPEELEARRRRELLEVSA
jgi:ferric iron reductase protein FhuF